MSFEVGDFVFYDAGGDGLYCRVVDPWRVPERARYGGRDFKFHVETIEEKMTRDPHHIWLLGRPYSELSGNDTFRIRQNLWHVNPNFLSLIAPCAECEDDFRADDDYLCLGCRMGRPHQVPEEPKRKCMWDHPDECGVGGCVGCPHV